MLSRPDVLVLGVGGVLGEAWLTGTLAGIEDASGFDLAHCEYFVGSSAGSIVAARLAAGRRLRRPADTEAGAGRDSFTGSRALEPARPAGAVEIVQRAGAWALALGTPLAPLGLSLAAPAGAVARALGLRALPRPTETLGTLREEIDATGVDFDGRLRIVAVNRATGRRVVFGRPSAPTATVGQAVEASCTIPWMFAPVRIGEAEYVDGGVWSPTNLDAAPARRDTHVLCLNPTAGLGGTHPLASLARGGSRTAMSLEAGVLRGRGAAVALVAPDEASRVAMGADLMAREPRHRVLAAGYQQGLDLVRRRDSTPRRLPPLRSSLVTGS